MRKRVLLVGLLAIVVLPVVLGGWYFDLLPGLKRGPLQPPADNHVPVAEFTATPGDGEAPLTVSLDGSASRDPDGDELTYAWDFGNGQTGAGVKAGYTYSTAGNFTVKLTVTDPHGATHSVSRDVAVAGSNAEPVLAIIEPPDGTRVFGAQTWIRWEAGGTAKTTVRWRRDSAPDFAAVEVPEDELPVALLRPLQAGAKYEYFVEQRLGETVRRSGRRTFTVADGLVFDPPTVETTIARDYNQRVVLKLRNNTEKKLSIGARALAQFGDLPADVTGKGSVDDPVELGAGESIDLSLIIASVDATRERYEIPIEAGGAVGVARIKVGQPMLKLSLKVIATDPNTLAQTIEIVNDGDALGDLAVAIAAPNEREVRLQPAAQHASLPAGNRLHFVTSPVLYLEFQSLHAELECRAAGQSVRFPLEFTAPAGKRLLGVRTATSHSHSSRDGYCTNRPFSCSPLPGPHGNGPAGGKSPLAELFKGLDGSFVRHVEAAPGQPPSPLRRPTPRTCPIPPRCGAGSPCDPADLWAQVNRLLNAHPDAFGGRNKARATYSAWSSCGMAGDNICKEVQRIQKLKDGNQRVMDAYQALADLIGRGQWAPEARLPGKTWLDVAEQTIATQVGAGNLDDNPTPTTDSTITIPVPASDRCTAIDVLEAVTHELIHFNNPGPAEDPNNINDVRNHLLREVAHRRQMIPFYDQLLQRWGHCLQDCCVPDGQGGYTPIAAGLPRAPGLMHALVPPTFASIPCCGNQVGPDRDAAVSASPMRIGLFEALQRRATFTRAHRGAFAAPLSGAEQDSSDGAAGWHQGGRIAFAWHQAHDQVAFVAFDPRGAVVVPPQTIGTGRWPRVTAHGKMTAVAWESDDGCSVRIHDGKEWGQELLLAGKEAAIAFAPDGKLLAVTSAGLWQLAGEAFDRIGKTTYARPALAVDGDGKPHVAWQQGKKILVDGKEVDEGERPTLIFDAQGVAHLAYLRNGSLLLRSRQGEQWSGAETLPGKGAAWPALALGDKEVRLSYLGAAQRGPDAVWLHRLPDKLPVLLPSLAGNVTEAWLLVKFALNSEREHYRPHTVLVSLNDSWLQWFHETVPDGQYLLRVDPSQVFTSSGEPVTNRVAVKSWHMNAGHYSVNSDYKLTVRTAWSEYFAFAASPEEVIQSAGKDRTVNHDQPDLALLANSLDLPVQPPKTGYVDFPITIANLGEGISRAAKVVMLKGNDMLAEVDVPPLQPGQQRIVAMRLDGSLPSVQFVIRQPEPDFDPSNDTLDLRLWGSGNKDIKAKVSAKPLLQTLDVAPAWVMGQLPAGARLVGDWRWHEEPALLSPSSHAGPVAKGPSLHYFLHAPRPWLLDKNDNLIQYVYLDPKAPPKEIVLQLYAGGTQKGKRLYWGDNLLDLGGDSGMRVGALPPAGKWARLRIPLKHFGLTEAQVNGMLFGQYDGRAFWGPTTRSPADRDREPEIVVLPE